MSDRELTAIAAAMLFVVAAIGVSLAIRALRQYERDYGWHEGMGLNGPATVTTSVLINTERLRALMRCLYCVLAVIILTTEPSSWSRVISTAILVVVAALDDFKSYLWRQAQRKVAAYVRHKERHGQSAEGHE